MCPHHLSVLVPFVITFLLQLYSAKAFSLEPSTKDTNNAVKKDIVSRRDLLLGTVGIGGAVTYGKLVSDAVQKLSRGDLVYPEIHEQHVASTIEAAMMASIPLLSSETILDRPLRVLEVGIGKDCRVIRRKLYDKAISKVSSSKKIESIELTGIDISSPTETILTKSREMLKKVGTQCEINIELNFKKESISQPTDFPDGYFDCILSTLTLCSVDNQTLALQEIKRILRLNGGSYGYVEHTAVLPDEPYRVLELQQRLFDPLQQILADNCHLHRYTDATIAEVFGAEATALNCERFLVDGMWPVSCQSCGIYQRIL